MLEAGEKEVELNPNDAPVLAVMGQALARTYNAKAPDAAKQLDKAELYSKRAIEITPTLTSRRTLLTKRSANAKNDTLVMAHSGLGLVYIRRGKFSDAVPELEQSVKADSHPEPDPVNYYLLGVADSRRRTLKPRQRHSQNARRCRVRCKPLVRAAQRRQETKFYATERSELMKRQVADWRTFCDDQS